MKYKHEDIFEGLCTARQYYDQFEKPLRLEVNKIYRQKGFIYYCDYIIVWADARSAVGEAIRYGSGNSNVGERSLFINSSYKLGWKVGDNRPNMRLIEIE